MRIVWPRRSWGYPFVHYVNEKYREPDPDERKWYEPEQSEFFFR